MIAAAERPVIYAGGGVIISGASEELTEMALYGHIPVATTLTGKGCFPEDHELAMGMVGMHGTPYANYSLSQADVIFAVGVRFDDRVTGKLEAFAPHATFVHVDVDPAEISKNVAIDVPIVGDAKRVLTALVAELKKLELSPDRHLPWMMQVEAWKRDHPLIVREPEDGEIMPEWAINKIWEVTKGEAVVCTEVGQHQMWAAQHYLCRHPRRFISSGGLGTMGFGFPGGHRGAGGVARATGRRYRRRRVVPDDAAGAGHRGAVWAAGESLHHQQPVAGHGTSVAGAVLESALQPDVASNANPTSSSWPRRTGRRAFGSRGRRTWKRCCVWRFGSPGPAVIDIQGQAGGQRLPMIPAGGTIHDMMERD